MAFLIFDLTETLKKFDSKERIKQYQKMLLLTDSTKLIEIEEFMIAFKKYYKQYQIGLIKNDKEFFVQVFSSFGVKLNENELSKIRKFFFNCRKNFVSLTPFAKTTLERLERKGHSIGLLSNENKNWAEHDWKVLGINSKKLFHATLYASEINVSKPNIRLFNLILKKLKCKPEEAFMIGNNYEDDIVPAKDLGMKTIYLNLSDTKSNSKADYVIHSINEVLRIV